MKGMANLPDFQTPISAADFDKYPIASVIAAAKSKTCEDYDELFFAEARRLAESQDYAGFQFFRLLAEACSLVPQFGNPKKPFRAWKVDYVHQCSSVCAEHFTSEQCAAFKDALPKIADDELRARLADLVISQKFDHRLAATAVDAYLKSALQIVSREHWYPCVERLRRAIWWSSRRGIDAAVYKNVLSEAKRLVDDNHENDRGLFTAHLISLVITFDAAAALNYVEIAGKLGERARMNKQWYVARCYFSVLRDVHRVSKPPQDEKAMSAAVEEIAETFELEAEEAERASPPEYGKACHYYEEARNAYAGIKGKKERRVELYKKLLICQEHSIQETTFENIGANIPQPDLSKFVEATKRALKGKPFRESVLTLVSLFNSLDFEKTANEIRNPTDSSVWNHIYRQNLVDKHGKTKARKESVLVDDADDISQFEYAYCQGHAKWHWWLTTSGILVPALEQISEDHAVRPEDVAGVTERNELVPLDKVTLISRGLYYGFLGDLQLALHLLIPQFENSLRFVLHQRGALASTMDSAGLQKELNLNTLLPGHPALEQIFGKNLLWDFWALLVARWGGNIRNHVAHGMAADDGFFTPESIYTWCLLLKFYCLPLLAQSKSERPNPNTGP
jgi:hypothetical protein